MRDGRGVRLPVLLVLGVLLGLVGMHALVVPASETSHGAPVTPAAIEATHASATHATGTDAAPTPGHHDHDGAGHLLHLCLAVLAAAGLVLLAAWLFLGLLGRPASVALARRRTRGIPAERPPPVPRRLARLCVLRN